MSSGQGLSTCKYPQFSAVRFQLFSYYFNKITWNKNTTIKVKRFDQDWAAEDYAHLCCIIEFFVTISGSFLVEVTFWLR